MKRKKNSFLVLWTLVLVGLSSFVLPAHGQSLDGLSVSLFYDGKFVQTDPGNFDPDVKTYKAKISKVVTPNTVYLAINLPQGLTAKVTVDDVDLSGEKGDENTKIPYQYDSVYAFEGLGTAVGSKMTGTLFLKIGDTESKFTLNLERTEASDDARLKKFFVSYKETENADEWTDWGKDFTPAFSSANDRGGSYVDTLDVEIDSAKIAEKLGELLGETDGDAAVKAIFENLNATVSWVSNDNTGFKIENADEKTIGSAPEDTAKIKEALKDLIAKAKGEVSKKAFEDKEFRLNFELLDPFGSYTVKKGSTQQDPDPEETNLPHIGIEPGVTYTVTVTPPSGKSDSVLAFVFKSVPVFSFTDGKGFNPDVYFGTAKKDDFEVGVSDDLKGGLYGPRVKDIWLESLDGIKYEPEFHVDSTNYTLGVSASTSYTLAYTPSSNLEEGVTFKTFTLTDAAGTYYELRVYLQGVLETTYTVRTFILDSVATVKKVVLSYDRAGTDVAGSLEPAGSGVIEFKPLKHDADSVFLHIVRESKLSRVDVSDVTVKNESRRDTVSVDSVTTVVGIDIVDETNENVIGYGHSHDLLFTVIAEDKTSKDYAVRLKRSFDLSLDSVKFGLVESGTGYVITPAFKSEWDADSVTYRVTVPASVNFNDVRSFTELSVKDGQVVSNPILTYYPDGTVEYLIKVFAANVSGFGEKIYRFEFANPGSDASLRSLGVHPGSLDHGFVSTDTFYTVTLFPVEKQIVISAFASDSLATIEDGEEDFYSKPHNLTKTVDTISITVTAEDKVSKQVYLIAVRRDGTGIASVASVSNVYVSGGVLYVDTPEAERITVYTAGGQQLSGVSKPAGRISFAGLRGLLIVRGSSGWVKKVLI